jgi:hypothetical protein
MVMVEHWRTRLADHWRTLAFVAFGVGAAVVGFIFSGPAAGATALFTVFAGVLSRQPSHKSPKPRVSLSVARKIDLHPSHAVAAIFAQTSDEESATPEPSKADSKTIVFGGFRDLDHEAIREDAIARAKRSEPQDGMIGSMLFGAMGQFEKPTEKDREEFAQKVEAYGEDLKAWLERVAEPIKQEMEVLVATVVLDNPAPLDAAEARVNLRLADGFGMAPEVEELEEPPQVPAFPLRRSRLVPQGLGVDYGPHYPTVPSISALARTRSDRPRISLEEPTYEEADGAVVVSYPRRTVRHGETGTAGDDLRVRCSKPGSYKVAWEIHASNLEKPATGALTVSRDPEPGEPVQTLTDLEHLLVELGLASDKE